MHYICFIILNTTTSKMFLIFELKRINKNQSGYFLKIIS